MRERIQVARGSTARRANSTQIVVEIDDSRVPLVVDDDGEIGPDYGNADGPTHAQITRAAARLFGRRLHVRFVDACENGEALYEVTP